MSASIPASIPEAHSRISQSSKVKQQREPATNESPPTPKRTPPRTKPIVGGSQSKKGPRGRSSKPIINWLQRKLAGSVKPTRHESGEANQTRTEPGTVRAKPRSGSSGSRSTGRVSSAPSNPPSLLMPPRHGKSENGPGMIRRKTISLNGDDDGQRSYRSVEENELGLYTHGSSLARQSTWSPTSNAEADEDASMRPLPPSGPPSPSPSLSASSYMSDPHTFRSIAASTKPTTLLSIDLTPNGIGHIAQVPASPVSLFPRLPNHTRSNSAGASSNLNGGGSITFSALPPQSTSRPSSLNMIASSSTQSNAHGQQMSALQAPLHTSHHPRNNPRPSSPPMDNASMLTLASSAYAMSGTRAGASIPGWMSNTPSARAMDSMSHFGGSFVGDGEGDISSQYVLGDEYVHGERDADASVRALRPRSSRRGSWDSEASDWSAPLGSGNGLGTPSRSLWTTNSIRTGDQGINGKSEASGSINEHSGEPETPLQEPQPLEEDDAPTVQKILLPKRVDTTPKKEKSNGLLMSLADMSATNPVPTEVHQFADVSKEQGNSEPEVHESLADNQIDVWHSAPTTPFSP